VRQVPRCRTTEGAQGHVTPPAGSPDRDAHGGSHGWHGSCTARRRRQRGGDVRGLKRGGRAMPPHTVNHHDAPRLLGHTGADHSRVRGGPPGRGLFLGQRGSRGKPLCPGPAPTSPQRECGLSSGVAGPATPRAAGPTGPEGYMLWAGLLWGSRKVSWHRCWAPRSSARAWAASRPHCGPWRGTWSRGLSSRRPESYATH